MKTFRVCFAFALLFLPTVAKAQMSALNLNENAITKGQTGSEEQALSQLKRELVKAYVQGDAKTLERILADELTDTSDGVVLTKQYHLKYLSPRSGLTADFPTMHVRIYGNTAVVNGIETFETANKETTVYYRFTDTFLKREGGWQLIATQRQSLPVWKTRYMEVNELRVLTTQNCSQEPSLRSLHSQGPTFLRFINETSQPVVVYWLNFEGKRDPSESQKTTLNPGQSEGRSTYLTHPFLVTDASGKCLGIYLPTPEPSLAVIK
jgi:hypothetical protein